jgi:hypothetical protein
MVEPERSQIAILWRVACWINKATRSQTRQRPCTHTHISTHLRTHRIVYTLLCVRMISRTRTLPVLLHEANVVLCKIHMLTLLCAGVSVLSLTNFSVFAK